MNRSIMLLFALVLCLGVVPGVFGQQERIRPIDDCVDCGPPPPDDPCGFGNPIDDPTFFVQQQYRDFLFREPTGIELANDVAPLNSCLHAGNFACYNTERVHMSRRMWDHPEFRSQPRISNLMNPAFFSFQFEIYNNDDFVRLDYLVYLQRPHDISGFTFWLGSLDNGVRNSTSYFDCHIDGRCSTQSYNDSINAFLSSTEYRQRFGCP